MRYEVITDYARQRELIGDVMPCPEQSVMFAQFDGDELVAFQLLQVGLFAEGMWAKDARAQLRTLNNMLIKRVEDMGANPFQLMTMTRGDAQGERIGRCARRMGYEDTGWKVYRRVKKCQ